MAGTNCRVTRSSFLERTLPQVSGICHHVGLVAHAHFRLPVTLRITKRVFHDTIDAFAGVNLDLGGDLIRRSLFKYAAGINIGAFGVLADDGEVHVLAANAFERAK